jgi:hypothetical protein
MVHRHGRCWWSRNKGHYRVLSIAPLLVTRYTTHVRCILYPFLVLSLLVNVSAGPRDDQVKKDKADLKENEVWIYNDMERAFSLARAANKPLFIVYRCIP